MRITEKDYAEVSKQQGIGIAELKTIMAVESRGEGHLADGRPKILFEGHKFYENLDGKTEIRKKAMSERPDLCHKNWTDDYYKGGAAEWMRLAAAINYDREAALKSCSWGAFQILGSNHKAAGFATVQEMVNGMYKSERYHLEAVCKFIKSSKAMLRVLLSHDWVSFARLYNGPRFRENDYHNKLAKAFRQYSA